MLEVLRPQVNSGGSAVERCLYELCCLCLASITRTSFRTSHDPELHRSERSVETTEQNLPHLITERIHPVADSSSISLSSVVNVWTRPGSLGFAQELSADARVLDFALSRFERSQRRGQRPLTSAISMA
jgi:hypothetical protein